MIVENEIYQYFTDFENWISFNFFKKIYKILITKKLLYQIVLKL